jgi:two-component system, OmpR family, Ni(II)-sensor and/or redox sensor kinase NrsS
MANAIQYPPSGGQVEIELRPRDRLGVITVKETGIGIASGEQTQSFERFYRVDSDLIRQTGGTALGLTIVQAIGQKHQALWTVIIVELIVLYLF